DGILARNVTGVQTCALPISFWATVAKCVTEYQRRVPHLTQRFAQYDLFAETFDLSCLNRLQLRDNQQMVDLADPSGALQLVGTLRNPLAEHSDGNPVGAVRGYETDAPI